jgi:hypothetical protein
MLAEGRYRAVAQPGAHLSETKTGKAFVAVTFKVVRGEMAGETIDWSGWLTSPKSEDRTLASLRYCGWKGEDITDLGGLDQEVEIVVEHEEYEGKTRAKCAWVNSPRRELAADKAKALADRLRSRAAAAPIVDGPPASPFADPPEDGDPFP